MNFLENLNALFNYPRRRNIASGFKEQGKNFAFFVFFFFLWTTFCSSGRFEKRKEEERGFLSLKAINHPTTFFFNIFLCVWMSAICTYIRRMCMHACIYGRRKSKWECPPLTVCLSVSIWPSTYIRKKKEKEKRGRKKLFPSFSPFFRDTDAQWFQKLKMIYFWWN